MKLYSRLDFLTSCTEIPILNVTFKVLNFSFCPWNKINEAHCRSNARIILRSPSHFRIKTTSTPHHQHHWTQESLNSSFKESSHTSWKPMKSAGKSKHKDTGVVIFLKPTRKSPSIIILLITVPLDRAPHDNLLLSSGHLLPRKDMVASD